MTTAQPHAPRGPLVKRDLMDTPRLMDAPRCTATSKQSGQRCKRRPIPGGPVCVIHGGGAPQVQLAAMDRLRALQNPAIDRLAKLIAQEEFPTVAYAASRDVLDRTLGKPQEAINHSVLGAIVIKWEDENE
jgi:hypothetical protein